MAKQELIEEQPFKGKMAIIPGGSKGMGKAIARDFVQLGGSVCIIARGMEALKETEEECNKLKSDDSQFVEIISCDTTDMDKLKPLLTDFIDKHGIPDYLFNFVGFVCTSPILNKLIIINIFNKRYYPHRLIKYYLLTLLVRQQVLHHHLLH